MRACLKAYEEVVNSIIDAEKMGANAIIGIRSFHDELPEFSSERSIAVTLARFERRSGFKCGLFGWGYRPEFLSATAHKISMFGCCRNQQRQIVPGENHLHAHVDVAFQQFFAVNAAEPRPFAVTFARGDYGLYRRG